MKIKVVFGVALAVLTNSIGIADARSVGHGQTAGAVRGEAGSIAPSPRAGQPPVTLDVYTSPTGERFLLVNNEIDGDSTSFALPREPVRTRGNGAPSIQNTGVTTEPIIERSDGSGAWAVFVDGVFVGILTISSSGEVKFTAVSTQQK